MPTTLTHCVFRRGRHQLAIPATQVREVLHSPAMISLPRTPPVFTGLCHLRSEFIPVLDLDSFLNCELESQDDFLLVIEDSDCAWALMVDQVQAILSLEISDAPEVAEMNWDSAVVGWATHDQSVIQILDPGRVRELAEQQLAGTLNDLHPRQTVDHSMESIPV
jgi:chemotaxis signal transduction protein